MYKLYAIISEEALKKMNGARGKMVNNGGHAYEGALDDSQERFKKDFKAYKKQPGRVKICLIAPEAVLHELYAAYETVCGVHLVTDAAHTVFKEPTLTYLGLGPINVDLIREDLSGLKGL